MAVQLAGLGGFDSSAVITQLVDLASKPLTDLDTKKAQVDSASTTLGSFSTRLTTLKSAATALATTSGFSSMTASSTNTGIVTSVTGSAVASSYKVEVTHLAKAMKLRSDAQASATTALGQTGTLGLTIGAGTPLSISVSATDTLADVASKINQSGARVSAAIINAGGSYRLSVQGLDSGAANTVSFNETTGVNLGLSKPANLVETAQDARLLVDDLVVTRPTNQIADAIPGVTLALTKTTTEPATVSIASDSTALKTKINAFISAYNDAVQIGHNISGYGSTKATNPVLAADRGVRRSLDTISRLASGLIPGASASYGSLASVGISLSRDGVMSLDATKFDAALTKDATAVRKLFVTDAASGATGLMKTMSDAINGLITGDGAAIKGRIDALTAESKRLTDTRVKKEERVAAYEQQLRRQFATLDQAMSRYSSMSSAISGIGSGNF
jgi:flagellar hook-associated protein 2